MYMVSLYAENTSDCILNFTYLQWVCTYTYVIQYSKADWLAAFDLFQQVKYFILIACSL